MSRHTAGTIDAPQMSSSGVRADAEQLLDRLREGLSKGRSPLWAEDELERALSSSSPESREALRSAVGLLAGERRAVAFEHHARAALSANQAAEAADLESAALGVVARVLSS